MSCNFVCHDDRGNAYLFGVLKITIYCIYKPHHPMLPFLLYTKITVSPDAQPYLEVVAPATLPENYAFDAEVNGHAFTVKVPVGGVEEGQRFSVPFPANSNGYSGSAIPRVSVPVGHWKDGFCDCCRLGIIHPVLWNAWVRTYIY